MLLMIKTHEIIAANVDKLMKHKQMRQSEFAKKTGVSQRTISNALKPGSVGSVTMDTVEKIAFYFGIEVYHLLIPNLSVNDLVDIRIEDVIAKYTQASEHGRKEIIRTADNEFRYNIASQPASQPASQLASRAQPSPAQPSPSREQNRTEQNRTRAGLVEMWNEKERRINTDVDLMIAGSDRVAHNRRHTDMMADYKINGEPVNDNDNI